ncbi:MAG: ribbon-helix-helix domain-containing protein [archaeon]
MEVLTIRFNEGVLNNIDSAIKNNNFNSRTELIREAVRDKLEDLNREALINKFFSLRGKSKVKTSFEEDRKIRKQVSQELLKELEERFK